MDPECGLDGSTSKDSSSSSSELDDSTAPCFFVGRAGSSALHGTTQ